MVLVGGPTASGKSALALALAEAFDGVVVNADSMQVYGELRVLTARPDAAALARAPHALYGVLSARERCSAGHWRGLALEAISAAHGSGRLPIVVGGTGLYLRSLAVGLASVPPVPEDVHAAANALIETIGAAGLHARLQQRDPALARRLKPNDRQRVQRAWEVLEATGRSLGDWQREAGGDGGPKLRFYKLLVSPPRAELHAACDARFERMLEAGALAEVEAVSALGLTPDMPAAKAVGLAPLAAHLRGEIPLDEARRLAQRDTRRYAKRQSTWFRHQYAADAVLSAQFSESLAAGIFPFISRFLLTASS